MWPAPWARMRGSAGLGITYVMEPLVRDDLAQGRLREVLPQASIQEPGLFLYFPQRAARTAKLRALLDVVRELGGRAGASA